MATIQLSVRSARARELAHKLSQEEKRPIYAIVEEALETYASRKRRSNFKELLAKLQEHTWPREDGEVDLDDLINENRVPYQGIDL